MAFSLSGNDFIQTGTDDSASFIAACQAEPAIDVTQYGSNNTHSVFYLVDFNNIALKVQGSLEVTDMHRQIWVFSGTDTTSRLHVQNTGSLTLTSTQSRLGFDYVPENGTIIFAFDNNSTNWNHQTFQTDNGNTTRFNGITMRGEFSAWIRGDTTLENCVIEKVGNDGDIQFNISNGDTTVLRNVKIYCDGQSGITFRDGKPTIDNVQVFGARDAFNNEGGGNVDNLVIEGLDSDTGSTADLAQFSQNRRNVILNAKNGSRFVWADHLNEGNPDIKDSGMVEVIQTVRSKVVDGNGAAIAGAKLFIPDNPSLAVAASTAFVLAYFDTNAATVQRDTVQSTDASGLIPDFNVLIATGKSNGGDPSNGFIRGRGKNPVNYDWDTAEPDDIFDFGWISYGHGISLGEVALRGAGGTQLDATLVDDLLITEPVKATAAAYTTQEDPFKAYDHLKSYLVDNYAGEAETIVTRAGDTLDCRALDVVVDNATGPATLVGTTLTLNAATFTGNITTTGTVSTANGAVINGGIIDANGDSFLTFNSIDSWTVYATIGDRDADTNAAESGTGNYRFTFAAATTYYLRLVSNGVTFFREITPVASGETVVDLSTQALLASQATKEQIATQVWNHLEVDATTAGSQGQALKAARDHARASDAQTQQP